MRETLNVKDWIQISAYLDEKLSTAEAVRVNSRLASDPEFKQALNEIAYTRRMLWSLPKVRAPRNFTIAPEKVIAPVRQPWLQPALSFVSIAATAALVILFAGSYLLGGSKNASPMVAQAPEMSAELAPDAVNKAAGEPTNPPMIFWNPAYGMGGGGGGGNPVTDGYFGPGVGGGGAEGPGFTVPATLVPETPLITETPMPTEQPLRAMPTPEISSQDQTAGSGDPSTLILGLPDQANAGQMVESAPIPRETGGNKNRSTIFMVLAGGIALLSGAAALILRRR